MPSAVHKNQASPDHEFREVIPPAGMPSDHLAVEDIHRVRLAITADLGECFMQVRDVLELKRGSIIQLNKLAGEMCDIFVNGLPLAKGEVVVIGDTLHVRIGDIAGTEEKSGEETGDLYEDDGEY